MIVSVMKASSGLARPLKIRERLICIETVSAEGGADFTQSSINPQMRNQMKSTPSS